MNHRHASAFVFSATVAAAGLAAAVMTGGARAETPSDDILKFTGIRTRVEVKDEVRADRQLVSSASNEMTTLDKGLFTADSGYTRAEARAGYIGARDETRARTAEDSGSTYHAQVPRTVPVTVIAVTGQ
jgi:hypothetical protein